MALSNVEGMPDLQLRMSKKIAQLTKVIIHLNNKSEDNGPALQEVAEQYETEIEQILKDTADKVNLFKNKLEAARDDKRIQEIRKELETKHEDERRKMAAELENVRKRAAEKEAAIQKAATKQIDSLCLQVEQLQQQLREADALREAHSKYKEHEEAVQRAKQETEEAVQAGNKKYNDMLAERMHMEDQLQSTIDMLRAQLEAQVSGRREAEQALGERTQQWAGERADLQERHKVMDASWKSKVEALVEELQREKTEARAAAKQAASDENRARVSMAELQEALRRGEAEAKAKTMQAERLAAELEALQLGGSAATKELQGKLARAEEQVGSCEAAGVRLQQADDEICVLEKAHARDLEALDRSVTAARAEQERLALVLKAREEEVAAAQTELKTTQEELQQQYNELLAVKASHSSTVQQLAARISGLEEDAGRVRMAEQTNAAAAAKQMQEDMERKLAAAEARHVQALESAKRDAASQLEASRADAALRLSAAEQQLRSEMTELKRRLDQEKADALQRQSQVHARECEVLNSEAAGLKLKVAELMQLLADEQRRRDELEQEATRLAGQIASQGKSCQCQQGTAGGAAEGAGGSRGCTAGRGSDIEGPAGRASKVKLASDKAIQALRQQLAAVQEDLQASQQQLEAARNHAVKELAAEVARVEHEWASKAANQVKDAVVQCEQRLQAELAALQQLMSKEGAGAEARLREELNRQLNEAAEKLEALREKHVQELEAERRKAADRLQSEQARAAGELQAERQRADDEMAALSQQHQQHLAELQLQAAARRQGTEEELRDAMTAALAAQKQAADGVLAALQAEHRLEVERLEAQRAAKTKAAEALSQAAAQERAAAARQLQQVEAQLRSEMEGKVSSMQKAHDEVVSKLAREHAAGMEALRSQAAAEQAAAATRQVELQAEVAKLEKHGAELEGQRQALGVELQGLKQRVEDLQLSMANRSAEAMEANLTLKQEHADETTKLLSLHREDKEALSAGHAHAVHMLQQQLQQAREEAEARHAAMEVQHEELLSKLAARASREEDLLRIRQLESALQDAGDRVRTAEERMLSMRTELLQREETYNKFFKNGGAAEKVLNVGSAKNAEAGVVGWMLNRRSSTSLGSREGRDTTGKK